jgi:hypothetical protein
MRAPPCEGRLVAHTRKETAMPCTGGSENDAAIEIHYADHGSGNPIVLIYGYPPRLTRE